MRALAWLGLASAAAWGQISTGTHWAVAGDFPTLKQIGYDFAVTAVNNNPAQWRNTLDAADASGLQLIIGLTDHSHYRLNGETWSLSPTGESFLRYLATRASTVRAVFVFNEPYWVDPWTDQTSTCGVLSAAQLRNLRTLIKSVWPAARVFHDIGAPSVWAPGGQVQRDYPCIGQKYADQTGVADLVGIWFYPFERTGYRKAEGLAALGREIAFVRDRIGGQAVIAGQSFVCPNCEEATRWPTADEIKDWNCALRGLNPAAISWYVWKQEIYRDYLINHPDHWSRTVHSACAVTAAAPKPVLSSVASAAVMDSRFPVAPGSIISLFGDDFAPAPRIPGSTSLPRQIDSTMVLINNVAAPLYFLAKTQINAQVPFEIGPGPAVLQVKRGEEFSGRLNLSVVAAAPGLFTVSQDGRGAAVAVDGVTNRLIDAQNPAAAGQYVVLYATGLGALRDGAGSGEPFAAASEAVTRPGVTVGGRAATVHYAGAAPGYVGLYQINIQVPEGVPAGAQTVRVTQGAQQSNAATLFIR